MRLVVPNIVDFSKNNSRKNLTFYFKSVTTNIKKVQQTMVKRSKLNLSTTSDIYKKKINISAPSQISSQILVEFLQDCILDIGDYITIDKKGYPKVSQRKGTLLYVFEDKTRSGYCYDQQIENTMLTMFIPAKYVKPIITQNK